MITNVYDRIMRFEADDVTKLVGGAAESWTISDDGKTTPMIVATVASSRVAGKKCMRSERTGLEVIIEWPKSPVSTRFR